MERIIEMIDKSIIKKDIPVEDMELFNFGLKRFLTNSFIIGLIFALSSLLHISFQTLVFLIIFLLLRSNTGGYHFGTSKVCFVFSLVMPLLVCSITSYVAISSKSIMTCFIFASLLTILLSPVDHPNKVLYENDKTYFKRKTLMVILMLYCIIIFSVFLNLKTISKFIEVAVIMNCISMVFALIKNQCRNR